jgi:hypothetical protein
MPRHAHRGHPQRHSCRASDPPVSHALAVGGAGGVGLTGGATPGISYATATLLTIGYSLAALTITATLLTRRHQLNCTCQSARDARTTGRDRRAVRGASGQRGCSRPRRFHATVEVHRDARQGLAWPELGMASVDGWHSMRCRRCLETAVNDVVKPGTAQRASRGTARCTSSRSFHRVRVNRRVFRSLACPAGVGGALGVGE